MNGGSWSSPFSPNPSQPQQQYQPRNYAEVFDERDYQCKTDIELESYARNLSNYLDKLLKDTPFPAFLFEKLEKRYNGILSILKKRSAAKGVSTTAGQARERLQRLNASLDALSSTQPTEPDDCEDHRPPKKQRLFEFNEEVRRQLKDERKRKERPKGEEEEEEEQ